MTVTLRSPARPKTLIFATVAAYLLVALSCLSLSPCAYLSSTVGAKASTIASVKLWPPSGNVRIQQREPDATTRSVEPVPMSRMTMGSTLNSFTGKRYLPRHELGGQGISQACRYLISDPLSAVFCSRPAGRAVVFAVSFLATKRTRTRCRDGSGSHSSSPR